MDESFEIVNKEEAEELSLLVTCALLSHPETCMLTPVELSKAVTQTLDTSQKKRSLLARAWTMYRYARWGYTAFTLYHSPLLAKIIVFGIAYL
jgi:hypothetical protein